MQTDRFLEAREQYTYVTTQACHFNQAYNFYELKTPHLTTTITINSKTFSIC